MGLYIYMAAGGDGKWGFYRSITPPYGVNLE
jgi:hypothetical protein